MTVDMKSIWLKPLFKLKDIERHFVEITRFKFEFYRKGSILDLSYSYVPKAPMPIVFSLHDICILYFISILPKHVRITCAYEMSKQFIHFVDDAVIRNQYTQKVMVVKWDYNRKCYWRFLEKREYNKQFGVNLSITSMVLIPDVFLRNFQEGADGLFKECFPSGDTSSFDPRRARIFPGRKKVQQLPT